MKKIIIFIAFLIVIFSGFYFLDQRFNFKNQSFKKISVSLNSVNYQINEGKTALDLLKKDHQIETKGEGANAYVVAIDGKKALSEKREYWAFYVNGKLADVGAGSYKLKNGDKIEWKIEKY